MPYNNQTIPIYTAAMSLDVRYKFASEETSTIVRGADTHAILYAGYEGLMDTRASIVTKLGKPKYSANLDMVNFATGAVKMLFTDTSPEEGSLGDDVEQASFALSINAGKTTNRIYNCMDLYDENFADPQEYPDVPANKSARNYEFNISLFQRINVLKDVVKHYEFLPGTILTEEGLKKSIAKANFHDIFHHTEQGIMHRLSCPDGIDSLVATAQSLKAKYLYGIHIDIFTVRMMCKNCNTCMVGMQNSQDEGFLNDFTAALKKAGIATDEKYPMVGFCVSAEKAGLQSEDKSEDKSKVINTTKTKPKTIKSSFEPNTLKEKGEIHNFVTDEYPRIFQAKSSALGVRKIINKKKYNIKSYQGAFFASRNFSKDELEKRIKLQHTTSSSTSRTLKPLKS